MIEHTGWCLLCMFIHQRMAVIIVLVLVSASATGKFAHCNGVVVFYSG